MIFDSHAHYDDERFNLDRDELLLNLPMMGVEGVINSGSDIASSKASIQLAEAFPYIYATVGVHPHEVKCMSESDLLGLTALAAHKKTVAIGEIGLDFFYDHSPRETQRLWFLKQLGLARKVGLPVVIHSRDAAQETMDILKSHHKENPQSKCAIHCYSGSAPMALEYVSMGYYIGIGGAITFDKTRRLLDVAAQVPLDKILVETDAPYQTPKPNRGKRNDSAQLVYVVEKIAEIKRIQPEKVAEATAENAREFFFVM